jgi:hypothetical protein
MNHDQPMLGQWQLRVVLEQGKPSALTQLEERLPKTHLHYVSFAEVPEVMLAHQMGSCLPHGAHIQGAILHKVVLVLTA